MLKVKLKSISCTAESRSAQLVLLVQDLGSLCDGKRKTEKGLGY